MQPKKTLARARDTRDAAEYLGVSVRTLEKWRQTGVGPIFRKVGAAAVRYTEDDLQEFMERAARINTSQGAA